jgi:hypothetical protein
VRAGAFSNSAHPDDDAKHGRLRNAMGHGGVYEVDGAWQARAECRGRRTQFFFHPMGAGAPAHPSIFFPFGLGPEGILVLRQDFLAMLKLRWEETGW